jgi:hypothetical protein
VEKYLRNISDILKIKYNILKAIENETLVARILKFNNQMFFTPIKSVYLLIFLVIMVVTVVPIFDPELKPAKPLAKVMTQRLQRLAKELEATHLKEVSLQEPFLADVVVYVSYNPKYTVRWRIVNDVPKQVELMVAATCARLGYILWKTDTLNLFQGAGGHAANHEA